MILLVDQFQQNLHSKTNYASALEHILTVCPELGQYMTDYLLVLTIQPGNTTVQLFFRN